MTEQYADEDFVYVDPHNRKVIGLVCWNGGTVKPMEMPEEAEGKPSKGHPRRRKKQYYPWCSYRTARRVYHVAGKEKNADRAMPLDTAMEKAQQEPYWD